jgi:hypothetical protein
MYAHASVFIFIVDAAVIFTPASLITIIGHAFSRTSLCVLRTHLEKSIL